MASRQENNKRPSRQEKKKMAHPKAVLTVALATSLAHGSGRHRPLFVAATAATPHEDENNTTMATNLKRLATTFESDRSSAGAMFDMKAKSSIIIRGLDINTVKTSTDDASRVEVWTKLGSFRGFENSPEAWTLWMNETITGNGQNMSTSILPEDLAPVTVAAREKRAFYVSFPDGPYLRYSLSDHDDGRLYYINRDLFFYARGAMKRRGFEGTAIYPRLFNGALHYETIPEPRIVKPNPQPTTDVPTGAQIKSITTTFESSVTYAGNMFDILARDDIEISSVAFNTYKTDDIPIKLYTKEGTHRGFDKDISQWTLVASLAVKGMGMGNPTYLPQGAFDPILVRRGERQSFYITSDGPYLRAAKGIAESSLPGEADRVASKSNSDVIIYEGVGKRYPIENPTFNRRVWNGILQYRPVDIPTLTPTTSRPTKMPSSAPTKIPTFKPTQKTTPSPRPLPDTSSRRDFRLRLYWQRGYYWQENRDEMWFCMECRNNCRSADSVYVDKCSKSSVQQRFVAVGDTLRPAHDPSLCLTTTGYSQDDPIRVYGCGGSRSDQQRFEGFRAQGKFELQPRGDSKHCVSQMHHPKKFERIYPEECRKTRDHDTTYWVVY